MDVRDKHSTYAAGEAWFGFLVPNGAQDVFKRPTLKQDATTSRSLGEGHLQMSEDTGGGGLLMHSTNDLEVSNELPTWATVAMPQAKQSKGSKMGRK